MGGCKPWTIHWGNIHVFICFCFVLLLFFSEKPLCVVNIPRSSAMQAVRRWLWGPTRSRWKWLHLETENRRGFFSHQDFLPSLFFSSPLPTKQMLSQWTVTCFSFCCACVCVCVGWSGGGVPQAFLPTPKLHSRHASHLGGGSQERKLLGYPEVKTRDEASQ